MYARFINATLEMTVASYGLVQNTNSFIDSFSAQAFGVEELALQLFGTLSFSADNRLVIDFFAKFPLFVVEDVAQAGTQIRIDAVEFSKSPGGGRWFSS
jgi:hypothetical protein